MNDSLWGVFTEGEGEWNVSVDLMNQSPLIAYSTLGLCSCSCEELVPGGCLCGANGDFEAGGFEGHSCT